MLASACFNYYEDEFFDAFRNTRADGAVITLREGPGRPPWAGGE